MASAQVVETSVTNNSPSQHSNHPDDLFQSRYVTPGFKPFANRSIDFVLTCLVIGPLLANSAFWRSLVLWFRIRLHEGIV